MKIVFIGGRDIHKIGGIENYMYNLSSHLIKEGHTPIVFCESDRNEEEDFEGIKVIYIKGPKSALLCKPYVGLIATLKAIYLIKDISIIHYNAWPPSLWSFIPRLLGIPSLMQGHGFEWKRTKYSRFQQRIMKFMEKITAKTNQHLIMCSEEQTEYFKKYYHRNPTTIPTAINLPDSTSEISIEYLRRYGIIPKKYFLFLARLVKDKNPDSLIQAFSSIHNADFQLVIAGDNPADTNYTNYIKSLAKDNPKIIFTGAVYGKDKESLLKYAYTFCIPSTIEGLSISLLEAMSYKIPIMASDIEANKEVLDPDCAIWHIPEDLKTIKEAFVNCINSVGKFSNMTEQNYNKIKNRYTWEHVTRSYIKYINNIINN